MKTPDLGVGDEFHVVSAERWSLPGGFSRLRSWQAVRRRSGPLFDRIAGRIQYDPKFSQRRFDRSQPR